MIQIKEFTDITYAVDSKVAVITINRPDRYNALRGRTVDELLAAFKYAWVDKKVGSVILTGAGEKAFCTGGDQKERAQTGGYGENETGMFEIESLHKIIRAIPKPVIAAVNGFAIGYRDVPQVAASNVTIAASDAGKHYYSTTAGNLTLTIPNNATTSFATGTAISIVVQAAGNVLVNAASGVTLYMAGNSTAANRVVGTYGMATLLKVASDTWFINGTGVS